MLQLLRIVDINSCETFSLFMSLHEIYEYYNLSLKNILEKIVVATCLFKKKQIYNTYIFVCA